MKKLILFIILFPSFSWAICTETTCYHYVIRPYAITTSGIGTNTVSNVFTPTYNCTSGSYYGNSIDITTEIIPSTIRRVTARLSIYYLSLGGVWTSVYSGDIYYYLPSGETYTTYRPPSFASYFSWSTSSDSALFPTDGTQCQAPPPPPTTACSVQTEIGCFRYYMSGHYIASGAAPNPFTSFTPVNACNGLDLNGTANLIPQSFPVSSSTQHQFARVFVDELIGGSWKPIYNDTSPLIVLPYDSTHPLGWVPDGWMTKTQAESLNTSGTQCSSPCPNPVAESAFLDTCPFKLGSYNCPNPSQSTCTLKTCSEVNTYVSQNLNTLCPGQTDPAVSSNFTCTDNIPPSLPTLSPFSCVECAPIRDPWATQNCGGLQYLQSFSCITKTGICKSCEDKKSVYAPTCGGLSNVENFDCIANTGTCKDCPSQKDNYGIANCGGSEFAVIDSCESHVFHCMTCEERKTYESNLHCSGPSNIKEPFNCQTFLAECDCQKMLIEWKNKNCFESQQAIVYNCPTNTGTCGDYSKSGAGFCNNEMLKCSSRCGGASKMVFTCKDNVISTPCDCIASSVNVDIVDGQPVGTTDLGDITPSPSTTSQPTNTSDQNFSAVVDNTNAINTTLGDGFNQLHDDNQVVQGKLSEIKDQNDSLNSLLSDGSYTGTVGEKGELIPPDRGFSGRVTTSLQDFSTSMKNTDLFTFGSGLFNNIPTSSETTISVDFGSTFGGSKSFDFATWSSSFSVIKGAILLLFSFISYRVIVLKH